MINLKISFNSSAHKQLVGNRLRYGSLSSPDRLLSQQVYGQEAFNVMDKSPDIKFWSAVENRMFGTYFKKGVESIEQALDPRVPQNGNILELMCGRLSHYKKQTGRNIHGIGLVEKSLEQNPELSSYQTYDINANPWISSATKFKAAVITFGLPYMTRPLETFSSVHDLLEPQGKILLVFSINQYNQEKATKIWNENCLNVSSFDGILRLTGDLLSRSGFINLFAQKIEVLWKNDNRTFLVTAEKGLEASPLTF